MKIAKRYGVRSGVSFLLLAAIVATVGYLTRITEFSPIYFLSPAFAALMFAVSRWRRGIWLSPDILLALLLLFYVSFLNVGNYNNGSFVNLSLGLFSYVTVRIYAKMLEIERLCATFNAATWVVIWLLSIDTTIRLLAPSPPTADYVERLVQNQESFRYLYKFGGFMFADSNSTGLVALIFLFASIEINRPHRLRKQEYFLVAILIASLSYSVYFTIFVFLIFSLLRRRIDRSNIHVKFLLIVVGIPFLSLFFQSFLENQSLNSKIYIANTALQYLENSNSITLLFGAGVGLGIEALTIFSHNLFLTYLIETGLVGLAIISAFFAYVAFNSDRITVLAALLASMSYFLYLGTPFLFVPLALVVTVKQKRRVLGAERKKIIAPHLGTGKLSGIAGQYSSNNFAGEGFSSSTS